MNKNAMKKMLIMWMLSFNMLVFMLWGSARVYNSYVMARDCTGYLKQAADANTVSLADERLQKAIFYIEKNELTNGTTAVLFYVPSNDLGFWYRNLKASLSELNTLSTESTPLEKSNMLIKLRETLVDHTGEGIKVTAPSGISVFPYNKLYCFVGWISGLTMISCVVYLLITYGY